MNSSILTEKELEIIRDKFIIEKRIKLLFNVIEDMKVITKEKENLIVKLNDANKLKTDLVRMVSHELRTPLTSIIGFTELMLDESVGTITDNQSEYLQTILNNAERLKNLITDFLDVEKIQSGVIAFNFKKENLIKILHSVLVTFSILAKNKNLELLKEYKEKEIIINCDKDRIIQVFSNLISNSIKYTKEGKVIVKCYSEDNKVIVEILDTGVGMEDEDLKKLFTKFFRSGNKYVREAGGTGLGLSIVKTILEKHNAKIEVESQYGQGSKFKIIFKQNQLIHRK